MDELEKYLLINIICLYLDCLDVPGKKVCINIDVGPNHINPELMAPPIYKEQTKEDFQCGPG